MPSLTNYEDAWRTLTNGMHEAANYHELCSSYDDFIVTMNASLPHDLQIPARMKNYEVSFNARLTPAAAEELEGMIDAWIEDECDTSTWSFEMDES